jgi:hypothetical protein
MTFGRQQYILNIKQGLYLNNVVQAVQQVKLSLLRVVVQRIFRTVMCMHVFVVIVYDLAPYHFNTVQCVKHGDSHM